MDESSTHLETFTDDELTRLALAADPLVTIDDDAVAWNPNASVQRGLLPDWYMPRPIAASRGRVTKAVIVVIVVAFVIVDAFGLCITSGFLSLA